MKKVLLSFGLLLGALGASRAAVLTLNNNTPTPGQYTTFADAQTAAAAGDTILVQASATSYGSITISKRLALIGPGHKPNTSSGVGATFGGVFISGNLTGVRIFGISLAGINGPFGDYLRNVDSLIIENVFNTGGVTAAGDCNYLVIRGTVFQNSAIVFGDTNIDGVIVENNYFSTGSSCLSGWGGTGAKLVSNNIFASSGGSNSLVSGSIRNTIFQNNIFYGIAANSGTQTDCLYANNLSFGHVSNNTLPPTGQNGSNNLVNVDPKIVNIPAPTSAAFAYTRNYRLQADSPCKGAGIGGTDIGLYEPDFEFSMTGEPQRPQALSLNPNPAVVPNGGTTTVNFTIRKSTVNAQ
jgi:hypothetical protein